MKKKYFFSLYILFILWFGYSHAQCTLNLKLFIEGYYLGSGQMQPAMKNELVNGALTTQADTIRVILHDASNPGIVADSGNAILMTDGTASIFFSNAISGSSYWVAIRHRNALHTWSAAPVAFNSSTSYDFTSARSNVYQNNMNDILNDGTWSFFCGDLDQEENSDILDFSLLQNRIVAGSFGYFSSDLNGDGNVDILDYPLLNYSITNGLYSHHPIY